MKIRASASAERDLIDIKRYIALQSPRAADSVIGRIGSSARRLADSPEMGRVGAISGTREWVVRGLPYVIVYEVDWARREIVLLNVFHGARNRPAK